MTQEEKDNILIEFIKGVELDLSNGRKPLFYVCNDLKNQRLTLSTVIDIDANVVQDICTQLGQDLTEFTE